MRDGKEGPYSLLWLHVEVSSLLCAMLYSSLQPKKKKIHL